MPQVLGIDDVVPCRGLVYATILIDAETGHRVDVLQGRTADVVERIVHSDADRDRQRAWATRSGCVQLMLRGNRTSRRAGGISARVELLAKNQYLRYTGKFRLFRIVHRDM